MKKRIRILIAALASALLVGGLAFADDNIEAAYDWEQYYKVDDYGKYNSPASENGLNGTLLKIEGIIADIRELESVTAYLVIDGNDKWTATSMVPITANPGDSIIIYGVYIASSEINDYMPIIMMMRAIKNGEICAPTASMTTLINALEGKSLEDIRLVLNGDSSSMGEATPGKITVLVNGEVIAFDQQPQNINGRVMVPIRYVVEKMGCSVEWDAQTQTVYINSPGAALNKAAQKSANINVYLNNEAVAFPDQAPVNIGGRILIPVRPVVEKLGYTVGWDGALQTVNIDGPAVPSVPITTPSITPTPAPAPVITPTPTPAPAPATQRTVYYTQTGTKYHYENPCGSGKYYPCTLEEAQRRGLGPCGKCVLH